MSASETKVSASHCSRHTAEQVASKFIEVFGSFSGIRIQAVFVYEQQL